MRAVCTFWSFNRTGKFGVNARRGAGQRASLGLPYVQNAT